MSAVNASLLERTVGELVAEQPSRSRIFEKVGIDYCCKGNVALGVACEAKGVAVEPILAALKTQPAVTEDGDITALYKSADDLVDYIVNKHHAYMRECLPRLAFMTEKVAGVHGHEDKRLGQLHQAFMQFKAETDGHLDKEEVMLFPFIKMLAKGQRPPFPPTVMMPIRRMLEEHLDHGRNLEHFRELTDDYVPPPQACNTYLAMLQGLEEMEGDLHRHIHLENTVLYPWAERMEQDLGVDQSAFSGLSCH
ncbi:MAG: iron-sulfur cluster repair di-iron protein [Holophagaceae bacterium]|nr:iron-sulfur cluster repair di-iron protein [Holophagaceae bacterium]